MFALFGEFVRDFGCVFVTLSEALLIEIQEEIHPFVFFLGGGGSRVTKIVNKHFVNTLASLPRERNPVNGKPPFSDRVLVDATLEGSKGH